MTKVLVRATEPSNKKCRYYKLGERYVANWGSFVLLQIRGNIVTNRGRFIIINWGK